MAMSGYPLDVTAGCPDLDVAPAVVSAVEPTPVPREMVDLHIEGESRDAQVVANLNHPAVLEW